MGVYFTVFQITVAKESWVRQGSSWSESTNHTDIYTKSPRSFPLFSLPYG